MAGEAVLGAAVQVLLQNLLEYSFGEIKRAFGCKKEITKLQSSLDMVQKFMSDAEKKEINGEAIKCWLQQLEDVAFEADAVLDEFNYKLLRKKVKNQNQVLNIFPSGSTNFNFRRKMAHKIEDLNEKLEKINKDAGSYGLQMAVASGSVVDWGVAGQKETDAFSLGHNFVGRENDVAKLVEMLVTAPSDEFFSVIPIVGMGGLGKTTLARNVFNHQKIEDHFGLKIWVSVPVNFDAVTLFKMILESLSGDIVQGFMTKQVVLEKIKMILEKKRCLLVLDGIWSEEFNMWEDFISSLSGITSERGNAIVVTTRKGTTAWNVKTHYIHSLHNLSENGCWSIIKANAFLGRVNVPEGFKRIGKCISQRCGGLPLAAKVIGAFLRGKSEDAWLNLLNSQSLSLEHNENLVMKILRLSYDNLPSSSIKKCFAYCSILPPHILIYRDQMIRLWMAEGFLQGDRRNDMEAVGDIYFEHLLQSSLFQDVQRDSFGYILHCRMHSFVHELACSISRSSSIHQGPSQSNDMQHVRYLRKHSVDRYFTLGEESKLLRSFYLIDAKAAPNFSAFSSLRSLTLSSSCIEVLPAEIEKLIHLRLLDVENTSIRCLPDSICKLFNLQSLLTPKVLEKFPHALPGLISLRHLAFPPIELPPGIGRLTSLRTLSWYKVGNAKGCRIGELANLENLKGRLHIQNLESVNDKAEAEQAKLFGKRNVYDLLLRWNKVRQDEANDEDVLEGLQPHPNLKGLAIDGYEGKRFPLWIMRMENLTNVTQISLVRCRRCEEIPMLGHLPYLKMLKLSDLPEVRCIGLSFYGYETSSKTSTTKISFPALEELRLRNMPNLTDWVDIEGHAVVFPRLSYMRISTCSNLKSVPHHFPGLKELLVDEVNAEFSLSNVCSNTSSFQKLNISKLPGLIHLPEELFVKNEELWHLEINSCPSLTRLVPSLLGGGASLRELEINDCESLSELPDDLDTLHSLEKLIIFGCPKLKSIPSVREGSQGLKSLQRLEIYNCRELSNLASEILESCKSTLSSLWLSNLENLETASVISCLPRLSRLAYLNLSHLPKLVTFPTAEVSCLRNLRALTIGGYSSSESIDEVSFTHHLNRILQDHHHLEFLWLIGKEDWDSLPAVDTQHLTNLRKLFLEGFGFEALPEWIGNISSLQNLFILNCKKLNHMPSKEAMQRLTKLSFLEIDNCPLMKESFTSSDDDSEWAKVSHIQKVKVDWQPFTRIYLEEKNPCCFPIPRRNGGGQSPSS